MGWFGNPKGDRTGAGATLTLVTSDIKLRLKTARLVGGDSVESIPAYELDATHKRYLPGKIKDPGIVECECYRDGQSAALVKQAIGLVQPYVLSFQKGEDEEVAEEQTGACFVMAAGDESLTETDPLMFTVRIQLTDAQELTPAKLAAG